MPPLFVGNTVIKLDKTESTNSYAIALLRKQKVFEGTVIYTLNQTNGRGQRGNEWSSEPLKNLTFSLILTPNFLTADQQFLLTQMISLAICDFVAAIGNNSLSNDKIGIKWPNDILIDKKKVCGVLIENTISGNVIKYSIIGIGLNLNQEKFENFQTAATSLKSELHAEFEIEYSLKEFLVFIEKRYLQLKRNEISVLQKEYFQKLIGVGGESNFKLKNNLVKGIIKGVSSSGKLQVLLIGNNTIEEFQFKEIQIVV